MISQRKIFTVQNLAEKLKQARAFVLTDYRGLNVSQINELRAEIKKVGGEFEVVKNTLLKLALTDSTKRSDQPIPPSEAINRFLTGPTAALWIYNEDLSPLKALNNFIAKTELPKIKFGFWQGELISPERIKELMTLPSLAELQAKLLGILKSPSFGLVNVLNGNLRKLVFVLKAKGGEQKIKNLK
jgi:large subunit ribosomal protein L10